MRIVILGSGNVATHLSQTLYEAGHEIIQVYSRNITHAENLASKFDCSYTDSFENIIGNADIYICSVTDSSQEEVWRNLSEKSVMKDGIVTHTSGSMSLESISKYFHRSGVFYPLQSFSKNKPVDLSHTPFLIEGSDKETEDTIMKIAESISDKCYRLTSNQRSVIHLSAVFASNFVNSMCGEAYKIMEREGLDFEILMPLIKETIGKLEYLSPKTAQTGPAVRNDHNIMNLHRMKLTGRQLEIYNLLSANIQETRDDI